MSPDFLPHKPTKIVGIGSNYRQHIKEMGKTAPVVPKVFLKPTTALIGPGAPICIPPGTVRVDHEAELGVVIGRRMCRIDAAEALDYVAGYTAVNDVTARDFQRADGVFARAKGFDSFCPVGPVLATDIDPSDLRVRAWVDGELRQDGRTSDMIFDVPRLLEFVSAIMTLEPGDILTTGTPSGVGPLQAGQVVVIEVEGIGRLENPVVNRADRGSG
jgi:2-keto-4-pentenoate hydratase/2-oxohepta-3-ene-1,7-dioic acid hydratase in catechol pathway